MQKSAYLFARRAVRALLLLALVALSYFMFQRIVNWMLYYPMVYPDGDWQLQAQAGAEDVWLTAADGVRLHAWWFPKSGSQLATLFLHGNAGNVTHRIDHAEAIKEAGTSVLIVDYRGYGKSKGRPTERGLGLDAEAAYDELVRRGYGPNRIVGHGESLGTALAARIAEKRGCAGLILEAPFASLSKMAGTTLPVLGPLLVRGFNTERIIANVHAPVLVIHGDADETVPFSQGEAVFQAANQPKEFWRVRGARHNDLLYVAGAAYVPRLRAFYASLMGR